MVGFFFWYRFPMKTDAEILSMARALVGFEQKIAKVMERIKDIERHLGIAEAQKKRWVAFYEEKESEKPAAKTPVKKAAHAP